MGPKVSARHDHDGDARFEHCHQSGFQSKGIAGDGEYHARLNNTTEDGKQSVQFCSDPEQDLSLPADLQPPNHGCKEHGKDHGKDEHAKVKVDWES